MQSVELHSTAAVAGSATAHAQPASSICVDQSHSAHDIRTHLASRFVSSTTTTTTSSYVLSTHPYLPHNVFQRHLDADPGHRRPGAAIPHAAAPCQDERPARPRAAAARRRAKHEPRAAGVPHARAIHPERVHDPECRPA